MHDDEHYLVLQVDDVHDLLEALLADLLGGDEGAPLVFRDLEDVAQPLGDGVDVAVLGVARGGGHVEGHGEGRRVHVVEAGEGGLLGNAPAHQAERAGEGLGHVVEAACIAHCVVGGPA